MSVLDLRSRNKVPAVINSAGLVTLIDSTLAGETGAGTALINEAGLLVRGLHTTVAKGRAAQRDAPGDL